MKDIYIIGASGFGREIADTIRDINRNAKQDGRTAEWNIKGFIDDDKEKWGKTINDIRVVGGIDWAKKTGVKEKINAVIAIANPKIKEIIAKDLDSYVNWQLVIHPEAHISSKSVIGEGTIIQQFASIGPNTNLGVHCHINIRSNLGHDVVLGDYSSIMSTCDITGNVVVNKKVYIASMVSVIPGIIIGENAYIGAGSVVIKNVDKGNKMVGNPARKIGEVK